MTTSQAIRVDPSQLGTPVAMRGFPQWFKWRIQYNSNGLVGVAATTGNVDLAGFPGGTYIHGAFMRCGVAFTGGSVSAITASAGPTGSPAAYVAATTVFSGAPVTNKGLTLVPGTMIATSAPATVRVQFLSTSDNVGSLTAGWLDFFMLLSAVDIPASLGG